MQTQKFGYDNVVALSDRRKSRPKIDEAAAHHEFVLPAVKRLVDEGLSIQEVAEILRVAADILDGARSRL
jgi:hypothetical protein